MTRVTITLETHQFDPVGVTPLFSSAEDRVITILQMLKDGVVEFGGELVESVEIGVEEIARAPIPLRRSSAVA